MTCEKIHVCITCNKLFKTSHELARHKNKKKKCEVDENSLNKIIEPHIFIDIIKQKNCAMAKLDDIIKQQNDEMAQMKMDNLQNEIKLKDEIIILNKRCSTKKINNNSKKEIVNNDNTNNGTINNSNITNNVINNNTIHMTTHGRENTDHITIKEYNNLFKRYKKSVQMFVKLKHLDKNNKQNSNVYISNLHDKFIHVHKNKEWLIENEQEVLDEMCEVNSLFLIDKFNDMAEKDELNEASKKFDSFVNIMDDGKSIDYNNYGERIETVEKTNFKNEIKNDIKRDLYNGRHMVAPK